MKSSVTVKKHLASPGILRPIWIRRDKWSPRFITSGGLKTTPNKQIWSPELPGWQLEHKPLPGKELSGNSTVMWCGRILFCLPLPVSLEGKISPDHLCLNLSGRWWVRFNCSPQCPSLFGNLCHTPIVTKDILIWFCLYMYSVLLLNYKSCSVTVYKDGWHESTATVSLTQQFSNALWRQSAVREQAPPPLL